MATANDEARQTIGQLFIVGFHGQTADEYIKKLIRPPYYVGQIILFQRNVRDAEQLRALTTELQQIAKDAGHKNPLTIGIDQENGLVTRIQPPNTAQLPGSMTLGATKSPEDAYDVGRATAKALRAFGINMNYAPVCDVNNNPSNPVIGVRSFSDDPNAVARLAAANLNGLREEGVIPCVKHFPGHGDTAVDSHYGLPTIQKSWDDMEQCELVPFRRAVVEKVPAVMTAHIVIGDSKLPATLDSKILRSLRDDLKFTGVIVSDCLEMNAISTECGGTVQGAVTALRAGCDCVMICHTVDLQIGALDAVFDAALKDHDFMHQLKESCGRVSAFNQEKFTLDPGRSARFAYASFDQLTAVNEDNARVAERVYRRSTTLVRLRPGTIPLSRDQRPIIFVSPGENSVTSGVVENGDVKARIKDTPPDFIDVLRTYNPEIEELRFSVEGTNAEDILKAAASAGTVIFATRNARLSPHQTEMALKLASSIEKLIVIATSDPYDFLDDASIKTYLAIYEPTASAFKAAADVLFGVVSAEGHLPVQQHRLAYNIEPFSPSRDMESVLALWHQVLPGYRVPKPHLSSLLTRPRGNHFVVRRDSTAVGFIATFIQPPQPSKASDPPKGLIPAVLVHPSHQNEGVGTALVNHARTFLCMQRCVSVSIGSTFPRFFPGLPTDIAKNHHSWFFHRGFVPARGATARGELARDLWIDLTSNVPSTDITTRLARAAEMGITLRPWTRDGEQECLAKQHANFGGYSGWVEGYEALAAAGLHNQVMVAHAADGSQIAWTMMLEPGTSVFLPDLAFPPLLGDKTGLIACVGVDKEKREAGLGLALVAAALEDLKRRGAEKCFIDWVTLVGWYEKLGLRTWREYLTVEWRKAGSSSA